MVPGDIDRSRFSVTEHRLAGEGDDLRETGSQVAYWVRVDGLRPSPAMLGYVGDCVALGMFRAIDLEIASATSLDNTLRVGPHVDTDWVLLDLRSHVVADGYGHGTVYQWAPNGALMAMASQTLVLRPSS
jgi:acyl-CoA thioesterase